VPTDQSPQLGSYLYGSSISLRLESFFRCSTLPNGGIMNGFDCGRKSCSSSASSSGKH
jgi:hypothetical protein